MAISMTGCEILQDNNQREVVTLVKLSSPGCTLFMQKALASDASALEGSLIELDDAFKLDGIDGAGRRGE